MELKIGKFILNPHKPALMGILNVTPDSFSDGGSFYDTTRAVEHALEMNEEGADIIDIGGESSRPGAEPVSREEEMERVIPVIEEIRRRSDVPISIDTTKAKVAKAALNAGADMINDISAGSADGNMLKTAAEANVPICLMHMKGTPKTMQDNPVYKDIIEEISVFFQDAITRSIQNGIRPENIIIDPGIGFGKTSKDNILLIKNLHKFKSVNKNILIGTSKKSFIGKELGLDINNRLEATLATLSIAYQNGASILRVHDVGPAKRYLSMYQLLI